MIRVLFICHGNICRSPMAEFVMKDLSRKAGLEEALRIASAATSTEEIGNPGLSAGPAQAGGAPDQLRRKDGTPAPAEDYQEYDFLVGMDHANLCNMRRDAGRGSGGQAVPAAGPRRAFGGGDRRSLVYWGL